MKQLNSLRMVLIAGLPGTGKSTVARAFVEHYGGVHISSDSTRKAMNLRGHFDPEDKKKVYQAMLDKAQTALLAGQSAIVDSTFIHASVRNAFESVARACGVPFFWVEMRADENSIRERLKTPRTDSEADFSVFLALREQSEPLRTPHLELWSEKLPLDEMVQAIYHYTLSLSASP
ncbi:MAG: AAA family ATPase [Saprospiraceae bacterium]